MRVTNNGAGGVNGSNGATAGASGMPGGAGGPASAVNTGSTDPNNGLPLAVPGGYGGGASGQPRRRRRGRRGRGLGPGRGSGRRHRHRIQFPGHRLWFGDRRLRRFRLRWGRTAGWRGGGGRKRRLRQRHCQRHELGIGVQLGHLRKLLRRARAVSAPAGPAGAAGTQRARRRQSRRLPRERGGLCRRYRRPRRQRGRVGPADGSGRRRNAHQRQPGAALPTPLPSSGPESERRCRRQPGRRSAGWVGAAASALAEDDTKNTW